METEKDKAIESKGQQITNNLSLSSFFNDNNSCLFVFRKTEKLAAAIFLLTDLFEKDNPSGLPEHDDRLIMPVRFSK